MLSPLNVGLHLTVLSVCRRPVQPLIGEALVQYLYFGIRESSLPTLSLRIVDKSEAENEDESSI